MKLNPDELRQDILRREADAIAEAVRAGAVVLNKQEAKADAGKSQLTLVPRQILFDIARVREYGTKKYGDPENWRQAKRT